MCDLVIGDGEGARHPRVEQLAGDRLLHGEQARAAQRAVDVDGPSNRTDAVFRHDEHVGAAPARVPDQVGDEAVHGA